MNKKVVIFPSCTSRQTFFILFFSFLIILFAAIFVTNGLWNLSRRHIVVRNQAQQMIRLLLQTRKHKFESKRPLINLLKRHGVHVKESSYPLKRAIKITNPTVASLNQWLKHNPHGGKLALKLADKNWLNFNIRIVRPHIWWPVLGFSLLAAILFFMILILCFWTIRRLAFPVTEFVAAAQKLGMDVNVVPFAKTGNPEIDTIINSFNQIQMRVRKLVNDRTQMLAAISHDLRTPITRLKLRIEALSDVELQQKIASDLEEMEAMLTAVLTFAKEDVCNDVLERFDLSALLESTCNDMLDVGYDVVYQSEIARLPFFGCLNTLKRAFTNLLNNAVKYGVRAEVRLYCKDDKAVIEIDDFGSGIPAHELAKVFEPFYRVERSRSRKTGGTGLGLTIARDTIYAHNGTITLINRSMGGLRVTITLPVKG